MAAKKGPKPADVLATLEQFAPPQGGLLCAPNALKDTLAAWCYSASGKATAAQRKKAKTLGLGELFALDRTEEVHFRPKPNAKEKKASLEYHRLTPQGLSRLSELRAVQRAELEERLRSQLETPKGMLSILEEIRENEQGRTNGQERRRAEVRTLLHEFEERRANQARADRAELEALLNKHLQESQSELQQTSEYTSQLLTVLREGLTPAVAEMVRSFQGLAEQLQGPRATTQDPEAPRPGLRQIIKTAYDQLSQYVEFRDGMVEIPRLYHLVKQESADLSLAVFHDELERLADQGALQLHVCNDPDEVDEPDRGLRRKGRLYYYAYWRQQ